MIDWAKPVKCSNGMDAEPLFDANGSVRACQVGSVVYSHAAFDRLILHNPAPTKPEPVRHSAWLCLTADGGAAVAYLKPKGAFAVEVRQIAWMSDGSPPGEDDPVRYGVCETCVEKAVKRCDELIVERDKWRDNANDALDDLKAANDQIEQMALVVKAAVVWERQFSAQAGDRLVGAVRDYLRDVSCPKKTAEADIDTEPYSFEA